MDADHRGEHVAFVRPPALAGVEVLIAEHSARLWRVYHETYSICSVLDRGTPLASHWRYRGRDHVATEGSLMMMEPGELHVTRRVTGPGSFRVLMIEPEVVHAMAEAHCGSRREVHLSVPQAALPALCRAFGGLHASLESDAAALEVDERFHHSVCLWLDHCTESGTAPERKTSVRRLLEVRDYLREHYAQPVRLSELSAVGGLTPWHLTRAFTRHFGCPPHRYQLLFRLARARQWLVEGSTAAEAALAAGFTDQSALSRHFKNAWGIGPGRYAALAARQRRRPAKEQFSPSAAPQAEVHANVGEGETIP